LTLRVSRSKRDALERELPDDLRDRIAVEEPVPPQDVVDALRAHHVGVVFDRPLTRNAELSSPNKLFEYLMAGLAVVAPRLRGFESVLDDAALLYEPGSSAAMASELERLAADLPLLAELRGRARILALGRYNAAAQREVLAAAWRG
jgi:glycosyltransferase involved in cell wall biosynthesis